MRKNMSDTQSLVSVILPIYNMEKYLLKSVSTICNQTYQNIEIILVDDGSSDRSLQLCEDLHEKDRRIKVIAKENGGVSSARNIGLEEASGEWIMFVDPDDYLDPAIVNRLLSEVTDEVDIVSCCCNVFDDEGLNEVNHFFSGNRLFIGKEKKELYFQLMQSTYGQPNKTYTAIGVPWGKLYRREFLKKYNLIFDIKLKRVQDNIFNMYAFFYARGIKYVDEPLYKYRYSHMSDYFRTFRENYVDIFVAVREARYTCLLDTGLINDFKVMEFYIRESIINLIGILKNGVFHKENMVDFKIKIKEANTICSKECFSCVINGNCKLNMNYNICLFLVRNKLYRIFSILAHLK